MLAGCIPAQPKPDERASCPDYRADTEDQTPAVCCHDGSGIPGTKTCSYTDTREQEAVGDAPFINRDPFRHDSIAGGIDDRLTHAQEKPGSDQGHQGTGDCWRKPPGQGGEN